MPESTVWPFPFGFKFRQANGKQPVGDLNELIIERARVIRFNIEAAGFWKTLESEFWKERENFVQISFMHLLEKANKPKRGL